MKTPHIPEESINKSAPFFTSKIHVIKTAALVRPEITDTINTSADIFKTAIPELKISGIIKNAPKIIQKKILKKLTKTAPSRPETNPLVFFPE